MMHTCPTCGQETKIDGGWALAYSELTVQQKRLAEIVLRFPGISANELANLYYANDINGGPLDARGTVISNIRYANKKLVKHGFKLSGKRGINGYSLIKASEKDRKNDLDVTPPKGGAYHDHPTGAGL